MEKDLPAFTRMLHGIAFNRLTPKLVFTFGIATEARNNPMRFVYDISPSHQWFDAVANMFQLIQNDFKYYNHT